MPANECAIATCKNNHSKTRGKEISYHRFPKKESLLKVWIEKCKRKDIFNTKYARICSEHFGVDDFVRDFKGELLGSPTRKQLKPGVIPNRNMPFSKNSEKESSRSNRYIKKQKKALIEDILLSSSGNFNKISENNEESLQINLQEEQMNIINALKEENTKLSKENKAYKNKLLSFNSILKEKKTLKSKNMQMREQLNIYKRNERKIIVNSKKYAKNLLSKILTPGQVKALMGEKRVKWRSIDMCSAIALRAVSRKAYSYLRKSMNIPLPALSTMRKWTSQIEILPGVQNEILNLMKHKANQLTEGEKLCVLSIDEMKVSRKMSYDIKHDQVLGPHNYTIVCMARGILSPWKQPVYFNFDIKSSSLKEKIIEIIRNVEHAGYPVLGLVSDLGGSNRRFWKDFNVTTTQHFFYNPAAPERKVYIFADIPHMIKLLRNHILDNSIILKDGTEIKKSLFENLLSADNSELKLSFKITQKHLDVKGSERQKVKYAVQLLSENVSQAIQYLFPSCLKESKFIKLCDSFFDVMNSRKLFGDKPNRSAFGTNDNHIKILNEAYEEFSTMRVKNKKQLLPFQQGLLISINSTKALFENLKENYDIKYLLTHRFNQDLLENFFSQLRSLGHTYDHPTPLEVINRIKLLMLGKNLSEISSNNNVQEETENDNCISSLMISSASAFIPESLNPDEDTKEIDNLLNTEKISLASDTTSYQALRYIAGYICFKLKTTCPELSEKNAVLDLSNKNKLPDWISFISKGGLQHPTKEWMGIVQNLELMFNKIHNDGLNKMKGIVSHVCKKLSETYPANLHPAIKLFVKTRTMIRMNFLNQTLQENIHKKRKLFKTIT